MKSESKGKKLKYSSFLGLTKARKTTYEFSSKPVKGSAVMKILEAGRWAPSCTNLQPWHFIVVKDKKRIKKLMMTANYGDFHTDPTLMIALVLLRKCCPSPNYSCFQGMESQMQDSFMCIGMVGLNMVLEARELGIDSCILSPEQKAARKILLVNKSDAVPLIVGFGSQRIHAFQKKRERKSIAEITSYEIFRERERERGNYK